MKSQISDCSSTRRQIGSDVNYLLPPLTKEELKAERKYAPIAEEKKHKAMLAASKENKVT